MYKYSEIRLCPVCNSKKRPVKYAFKYLTVVQLLEKTPIVRALDISYYERTMDQTPSNSKMHSTRFTPFCKLVYRMIAFPIEQHGGVLINLFNMTEGLWVWAQKK
jgi:hypothetical protein